MALKMAYAVLLIMCMVMSAPIAQGGITCGQVTSSLSSCIPYLRDGGSMPQACCSGVKSLNAAANTTPNRQAACGCLKSTAVSIPGINYSLAAGLASKCGVKIPYPLKPNTDSDN